MRPIFCLSLILVCASFSSAQSADQTRLAKADLDRAEALAKDKDLPGAIAAAKKAVEEAPNFIEAHDAFKGYMDRLIVKPGGDTEKEMSIAQDKIRTQYGVWLKRFPDSAGVEYGIGSLFGDAEDPRARPFLLKAVSLNPKLAEAWADLCYDATRWGDEKAALNYMGKAAAAEPNSPDYAYYYADLMQEFDQAKYVGMALEVAKRFPNSERGAQALCWLGENSASDEDKVKYWEQDRAQFPPDKFEWSASAMAHLFDLYLRTDPDKAFALSEQMRAWATGYGATMWANNEALAQKILDVRKAMASGQYLEAKDLLKKVDISKYANQVATFELLKAKVSARSGDAKGAYGALVERYAKTPEDSVHEAILKYGADLGKTPAQVETDIWAARDATAQAAPPFSLHDYLTGGDKSLADYRGKVVLLTFWFPGCGPCRHEFPHFEAVLKKFRGEPIAYIGINVASSQNEYVKPFMKATRFSFTPLEDGKDSAEAKAFHAGVAPSNYLIDQEGRIVYSNFRADIGDGEKVLTNMISSLLNRPAASGVK